MIDADYLDSELRDLADRPTSLRAWLGRPLIVVLLRWLG